MKIHLESPRSQTASACGLRFAAHLTNRAHLITCVACKRRARAAHAPQAAASAASDIGLNGLVPTLRARLVPWYGEALVARAETFGIALRVLTEGERFTHASPLLARYAPGINAWPIPPAGLFVVAERTVYLRSASDMTLAHEFAHALDCTLGAGVYLSSTDARFARAFAAPGAHYVTPYAASAVDEYFAESVRAYIGANDPNCIWPPVSRERLRSIDPVMYGLIEEIFAA